MRLGQGGEGCEEEAVEATGYVRGSEKERGAGQKDGQGLGHGRVEDGICRGAAAVSPGPSLPPAPSTFCSLTDQLENSDSGAVASAPSVRTSAQS